jgi:hypothetical protein
MLGRPSAVQAADVLRGDGSRYQRVRRPDYPTLNRSHFSMSSLEIDYTPRVLWRLEHKGHQMEARLMPHAQYVAVVMLVNGQVRAAEAFEHQTDPELGRRAAADQR